MIGYLYYNFIILPQLNNLNDATDRYNNNKKILSGLTETQKNIDKIKKQVEDLNVQAEQYEKSIPDSGEIPQILMDFKTMTDSAGCTGGRLTFGNTPAKAAVTASNPPGAASNSEGSKNNPIDIVSIPVTYEIKGDYNSVMLLLKNIEGSSRKMIVNKVLFSKDSNDGKLSASLNISCYYINNKQSGPINYPFLHSTQGKQNLFN